MSSGIAGSATVKPMASGKPVAGLKVVAGRVAEIVDTLEVVCELADQLFFTHACRIAEARAQAAVVDNLLKLCAGAAREKSVSGRQ